MKTMNDYAEVISRTYSRTPKAVLAAIAVSFASRINGMNPGVADSALVEHEWWALYRNGIVTQKPPYPDVDPDGEEL